MSMPKGYRSKHGYATATQQEGLGYREIALKMSSSGDKMNHSTARYVLMRGLFKLAEPLARMHNVAPERLNEEVHRIIGDPRFQAGVADAIDEHFKRR